MQEEIVKITLNKEQSEKFLSCLMDEIKRIALEVKKQRMEQEKNT